MNVPNNNFCILPWVSIETTPIGTVHPCCLTDDEILDDNGIPFKLTQADFNDIQNSGHMRQLRQEFLDGKQPKTCRKCWNEEKAGRTSKRMHTLKRTRAILDTTQDWTTDAKPLMYLDLKLGNICNLKCRICGSWSSSTYAIEEIQQLPKDKQKLSPAYRQLTDGSWPKDNPTFWNQISQIVDQIRYIEFTGGEPFMIQEHFQLLEELVAKGVASQVEIHYNTNGTWYPEQAPEIWKHFKEVEIALSIDDLYERFEYQRTNANWNEVLTNLSKLITLREQYPSVIKLQLCCTINAFNVRYIDQVANWAVDRGFNYVHWNMLHDPYFFSIATLPDSAKQAITAHLEQASIPSQYQEEFKRIVKFMNSGASTDGFMLNMKIRDLDQKRNQSFRTHHSEMADLIDYTI